MRLTWKDALSTLFMAAIVAVYLAFLNGTSLWLISSARGATTAVFILGIVGGCALGAVGALYAGRQPRWLHAIVPPHEALNRMLPGRGGIELVVVGEIRRSRAGRRRDFLASRGGS